MNYYQRKLYALLQAPECADWGDYIVDNLDCLKNERDRLNDWWTNANIAQDIASSSDRVNLYPIEPNENPPNVRVRHPISGQKQQVTTLQRPISIPDISPITTETNAKKVFWWFWRFYPELLANTQYDALLFPAHTVIPDCPLHSHQSTVSAITGAMFPKCWKSEDKHETPYLLIFSFSPVQDFIKSSRKFLDFWAGSYLLHYLSAQLCWHIAQQLGPDAIILPSLWSQEIIDAWIAKKPWNFAPNFACIPNGAEPVERFTEKTSTSLSTAGFPNVITVLVPGKQAAKKWGQYLSKKLTKQWRKIGLKVRNDIREEVINFLNKSSQAELDKILQEVFPEFKDTPSALEPYQKELELLKRHCCWEWNKLWEVQLNHTWEPYWTGIPLGSPQHELISQKKTDGTFDQTWVDIQNRIAQPFDELPSEFETEFYTDLNVGTWWGSIQQRLGLCLNNVKYTRNWQIPTAPGERSTISGQFSAVHPRLNYQVTKTLDGQVHDLRQGSGLASGSMRLFWYLMSKVYRGLFNGSEKLNALELTKRMAWVYGGVAESLGIDVQKIVKQIKSPRKKGKRDFEIIQKNQVIHEQLVRFPNLSSIASARFLEENPELAGEYWQKLRAEINTNLPKYVGLFSFLTRRRFSQVPKTDAKINPHNRVGRNYNGVMFSSKWLIDDMGLQGDQATTLRSLIAEVHQTTGFGDSSPADWWVIILADGDGMGDYVTGKQLKKYRVYVEQKNVDRNIGNFNEDLFDEFLCETDKRMGPATHVGLNRALLDFSNRLVSHLTEKRFCGRVIYSGGDDVMVVLPLEDLPEYLLSLRAAWSGSQDPDQDQEFTNSRNGTGNEATGYWYPGEKVKNLPKRPHFTMGKSATMSAGVIIAHKSVPLPTVLESLWEAEKDRAKKIPGKDGICFRIIYGGGNQLEALMKGELLASWWNWVQQYNDWVQRYDKYEGNLSPLLYKLAEELPRRASITNNYDLFSKAAKVIMENRDNSTQLKDIFQSIEGWLDQWEEWAKLALQKWAEENLDDWEQQTPEDWVKKAQEKNSQPLGTRPEDLAKLLRFTAFWIDKRVERYKWRNN